MGVYIKGMEMPRDGYIVVRIYANGEVCEPTDCIGIVWGKVATAISVPPHGRLIDADALINALQDLFNERVREAEFTGNRGACVTWNDAIYHIKSAPTIIPAEEEWDK